MSLHFIRKESKIPAKATVVLLHGLGADEHDLMGLSPYLPGDLNVVSVRAPLPYAYGGFSWFGIDITPDGMTADGEQAVAGLHMLLELLEDVPEPVVLAGFSQGAMISIGMLLEHGNRVQGVVAMSGGWLPCFEAKNLSKARVLMTHGIYDQVVPFGLGEDSVARFREVGVEPDFRSYPMGHEISMDCLNDISEWLGSFKP